MGPPESLSAKPVTAESVPPPTKFGPVAPVIMKGERRNPSRRSPPAILKGDGKVAAGRAALAVSGKRLLSMLCRLKGDQRGSSISSTEAATSETMAMENRGLILVRRA